MRSHTIWMFVGPSGAGKTTLVRALRREVPDLYELVSTTTRARREGEVDGADYHFVTMERFEDMIASGEMVEHVRFGGNCYGLTKKEIESKLALGDILVVVEPEGAKQLAAAFPQMTVSVFLLPPDRAVLTARMLERGDSVESIARREEDDRRIMRFSREADIWLDPAPTEKWVEKMARLVWKARAGRIYRV